MKRTLLLYDGLWRCLCPQFDQRALRKAIQSPILFRPIPRLTPSLTRQRTQNRHYGTQTFTSADFSYPIEEQLLDSTSTQRLVLGKPVDELLLGPSQPTLKELALVTVDELTTALRRIRDIEGYQLYEGQDINRCERITLFVKFLLRSHGQYPSLFHYECMMDAMIDTQGSAEGVRALLSDMQTMRIAPTSTICQSALAALAVHPDYVLRQQIIDIMKQHWIPLEKTDQQHILLAQLREAQHELAYNGLMKMLKHKIQVDLWVLNIFVMVFGRLGYLDEMLQLFLYRKQAKGSDDSFFSLAYYVLDVCSNSFHYEGTIFAWNAAVRNGLLKPSEGILDNVLATAAREGDVELATEVHGIISTHGKIQVHHFEALTEAFAHDCDIAGALRVLWIMQRNGMQPSKLNTRVICEVLLQKPHLLEGTENALRDMAKNKSANPVMVATIVEAIAKVRGIEECMVLYRDIPHLCQGEYAPLALVQDLIIRCNDLETLSELVADYKKLQKMDSYEPQRHSITIDKLVHKLLGLDELDLAMHLAKIYMGKPTRDQDKKKRWLKELAEKAVAAQNSNLWSILDQVTKTGNQEAVDTIQRVLSVKRMASKVRARKTKAYAGV